MFGQIISKLKTGETHVSTDTRTIKSGDIFFAIKGEQFDGHDFVGQAFERGASMCVVSKEFAKSNHAGEDDKQYLVVDDTLKAIQTLATEYRKEFSIPVIGISGCNGKTTTKNFMASVLKEHFGKNENGFETVLYTLGNHNNFIGVPLTLLSLRPHHKIAVIELGSNHPGEIAELCIIVQPIHGITTNIGAAHIEFFGTLEAIADEEGALATFIPKEGAYTLPKNDQYSEYIAQKAKPGIAVHFVDIEHVECLDVEYSKNGGIKVQLASIGITASHVVQDALFVITMAHEIGIDSQTILAGLSKSENDEGRFTMLKKKLVNGNEVTVIDDTYNGNPDSVIAAIRAVAELYLGARKIVALGCLKELGKYAHTGYMRIIQTAYELGISELILVNIQDDFDDLSQEVLDMMKIVPVATNTECIDYLKAIAVEDDVILCKGSHGSKMWEVVRGL